MDNRNEQNNFNFFDSEKLLKEAIELTQNKWEEIKVNDLYGCLLDIYDGDKFDLRRRVRANAFNERKQTEIIHLIQLLRLFNRETLAPFTKELKREHPESTNNIQPLMDPDIKEVQPVLEVELNDNSKLILYTDGAFLKASTEV